MIPSRVLFPFKKLTDSFSSGNYLRAVTRASALRRRRTDVRQRRAHSGWAGLERSDDNETVGADVTESAVQARQVRQSDGSVDVSRERRLRKIRKAGAAPLPPFLRTIRPSVEA
jgi:hypothetical protein